MHKYINNLIQKGKALIPKRQEGQTREEYHQILKKQGLRIGAAALMVAAVISSVAAVAGNTVTVSNSVNGKELPVYCVETDKKQVALSFDAAWGNGRLRWGTETCWFAWGENVRANGKVWCFGMRWWTGLI